MLFPAIQERTRLRAGKLWSMCVRARASARKLKQERGKSVTLLLARVLALEEEEEEKFLSNESEKGSELSVLSQRRGEKNLLGLLEFINMQKRGKVCDAQTERVCSTFHSHSETDETSETHNNKHQSSGWPNPPLYGGGRRVADGTEVMRKPALTPLGRPSETHQGFWSRSPPLSYP